jgi:hypothetical protein
MFDYLHHYEAEEVEAVVVVLAVDSIVIISPTHYKPSEWRHLLFNNLIKF